MLCKKVLPLLSEYYDGVLDADATAQVSQHLNRCIRCRKELNSISALHDRLSSLDRVQAPEYLRTMVQSRLMSLQRDSRSTRLRNELERWWSLIRTTEGRWYLTRAAGTVMTCIFFILISVCISPPYNRVNAAANEWSALARNYVHLQAGQNLLSRLRWFSAQAQKTPAPKSDPAINDLYFLKYGESVSQDGKDDNLSVVTEVDSSGSAKIQYVLEHPQDETLLSNFNEMLAIARCRPAIENGQPVSSLMLLMFSKVFVYD
jgi:hypothetical protein